MISKIGDYRLMMCTAVLHGGVCHRTSTPHKSGNKMKEKKKVADNSLATCNDEVRSMPFNDVTRR